MLIHLKRFIETKKYCSLGPDREFETIAETFFDAEYKVDTNVLVF